MNRTGGGAVVLETDAEGVEVEGNAEVEAVEVEDAQPQQGRSGGGHDAGRHLTAVFGHVPAHPFVALS